MIAPKKKKERKEDFRNEIKFLALYHNTLARVTTALPTPVNFECTTIIFFFEILKHKKWCENFRDLFNSIFNKSTKKNLRFQNHCMLRKF